MFFEILERTLEGIPLLNAKSTSNQLSDCLSCHRPSLPHVITARCSLNIYFGSSQGENRPKALAQLFFRALCPEKEKKIALKLKGSSIILTR